MSEAPSFIELVMQGYVDADEIEDFVSAWHRSTSPTELHEYLGMTWEEYSLIMSDSYAIPTIIKARRDRVSLAKAVNDNLRYEERIAARSDNASKIAALHRWINAQPDR